jgi:hypothetical protein
MGREMETMRVQRARRPYTCDNCRRHAVIEQGDQYLYLFGVVDDLPVSARFCGACCRSEFYEGSRYATAWAQAQAGAGSEGQGEGA